MGVNGCILKQKKVVDLVRIGVVLFLLVGALYAAVDSTALFEFDSTITQHRHRTDSINTLIDSSEQQLALLTNKESEQLSQLNEIEALATISSSYIDSIDQEMARVQVEVDTLTGVVDSLETRQNLRVQLMSERLRQIHQMGQPTLLSILLGVSSPQEMSQRVAAMQQLGAYDTRLLNKINSAKEEILLQREALKSNQQHLLSLVDEQAEQNAVLQGRLSDRKNLLLAIQSEKSRYESAVEELQTAQEELSVFISSLVSKRKKLSIELEQSKKFAFEERKGTLMWPVDGRVLVKFGRIIHPVYKTVTVSKGVVIESPKGVAVLNVATGIVAYAGRMRGYGLLLMVDNGGGYSTVYTHLDQVLVTIGQTVKAGALVARVGESGSLDGPKLRFEIRGPKGAVDPLLWLEPRQAVETTP